MRQKYLKCSFLLMAIIFLLFSQPISGAELENMSRENILSHLQNAYYAQQSLSEKPREKEEMVHILSDYFDKGLTNQYLKENMVEENGQYIVYGTDFPIYVIPFFTYDEKTKIIEMQDHIIVYEFFPASTDGPVSYDDHYEWVKLLKTSKGLKISKINNYAKNLEGLDRTLQNDLEDSTNSISNVRSTENKQTEKSFFLDQTLNQILMPYLYSKTKTILHDVLF
ncbi:MAG TPA: DUF3993 domain-containing protein [Metabacillus sp.]|nr:DUF3993 domain-containing protein [Metabacillus sp.]